MPLVSTMSLRPIGMPCSGPFGPLRHDRRLGGARLGQGRAPRSDGQRRAAARRAHARDRGRRGSARPARAALPRSAARLRRSSGSRRSCQILLGEVVDHAPARPCGRAACAPARPSRRCRHRPSSARPFRRRSDQARRGRAETQMRRPLIGVGMRSPFAGCRATAELVAEPIARRIHKDTRGGVSGFGGGRRSTAMSSMPTTETQATSQNASM